MSDEPENGPGQPAEEALSYEDFRAVMGSFASGVSVVTTIDEDGTPYGLTCSAVCSVSAGPPLLLCCVRTPSRTLNTLRRCGRFAVNFLDAQARELSDLFAGRTTDKFALADWAPGPTLGMPVLARTVAHTECEVHEAVDAGDHMVVLGRMRSGRANTGRFPLGYWRGSYVGLFRMTASARP
ncbi:flavin reductase family protein [Actinoplanes sp. NPDC049681]|uniref:flavin reductase family protein n=1 Tax=Actinoplanes sp. NPDC049681 TaxID=3363905 RepID=UPI0037B2CCF4